MFVKFFVPGTPQPGGSKRGFARGGRVSVVDANPKAGPWKTHVSTIARAFLSGGPFPTRDPIVLKLCFYRARPLAHLGAKGIVKPRCENLRPIGRPDSLKLARGTEDALTGILYVDDAQVVQITSMKVYTSGTTGVLIAAWGLGEEVFRKFEEDCPDMPDAGDQPQIVGSPYVPIIPETVLF